MGLWFDPVSSVVVVRELGGWDVAELAVEAAVVEPFEPAEGGQPDVLDVAPRALAADQLATPPAAPWSERTASPSCRASPP